MYKSGTADVNITLDECQLDALRGDKAACGKCNSTLAGVVPVKCASPIGSLDVLWHNTDCKSRSLFIILPSLDKDNTNDIRYFTS